MVDSLRPDLRAYEAKSDGTTLTVVIRKEFDFGNLHQDWATFVLNEYPGHYQQVVIDLSLCGLVSSTFFAGLMQLHFHYTKKGAGKLVLDKPDPRVVRNLVVMRMDDFFEIRPR